ncbi:hypothetical protein FHR81_000571 [Actinoalloteichus hoggarensis]|uniref:Uncharacterized protein n=1 Tax=Actinoalloteichus hoggarensis TaxID=1470176 RepID=A0A221W1U4_9PSEU|nr:hypothetical protein [Actinoalloteichus hoggarensis]ASO19750.1 hypothetical protein AHOG_10535 [Actinoalloteichus hoggarensis]MBB5919542.1 hypothetical protein [Actinoalloteichus hoggarensis]
MLEFIEFDAEERATVLSLGAETASASGGAVIQTCCPAISLGRPIWRLMQARFAAMMPVPFRVLFAILWAEIEADPLWVVFADEPAMRIPLETRNSGSIRRSLPG